MLFDTYLVDDLFYMKIAILISNAKMLISQLDRSVEFLDSSTVLWEGVQTGTQKSMEGCQQKQNTP